MRHCRIALKSVTAPSAGGVSPQASIHSRKTIESVVCFCTNDTEAQDAGLVSAPQERFPVILG